MLLVFQAMDAAGKDGTIRAVLSGVNPAGCEVYAFKQPSHEELDHDFLWRIQRALPERGRIGVFNRSHYEEVLVVRVHPEFLDAERLPKQPKDLDDLWDAALRVDRRRRAALGAQRAVILKFFLNVSQKEQHERFLERIDEDDHNWKFAADDWRRARTGTTTRPPIRMRCARRASRGRPGTRSRRTRSRSCGARSPRSSSTRVSQLDLEYPTVTDEQKAKMAKIRKEMLAEDA